MNRKQKPIDLPILVVSHSAKCIPIEMETDSTYFDYLYFYAQTFVSLDIIPGELHITAREVTGTAGIDTASYLTRNLLELAIMALYKFLL